MFFSASLSRATSRLRLRLTTTPQTFLIGDGTHRPIKGGYAAVKMTVALFKILMLALRSRL